MAWMVLGASVFLVVTMASRASSALSDAIAPESACSVSLASPSITCCAGTSLLRSFASSVAWIMVLPFGICTPNPVSAKLHPIPKITSASWRKVWTVSGIARPPEPSDKGWVSGKALLPSRLVVTGIPQSSASCLLIPRFCIVHPLPCVNHWALGRR